MDTKRVVAYADGACEPNPGPGGVGVVLLFKDARREASQGFRLTTNNRMEITAAVLALQALKEPCRVTLHSDSKYLVDSMTKGAVSKWAEAGWKRSNGKRVPNSDLWETLIGLCKLHEVEFAWVQGHSGDPGNERADTLSYAALAGLELEDDIGYMRALEAEVEAPSRITIEGQPCRKCSTPVIRKIPKRSHKPGQEYFYEYYLLCPGCGTMYMVEDAKRYFSSEESGHA